jgi:hypothetical protein
MKFYDSKSVKLITVKAYPKVMIFGKEIIKQWD